MNCFMDTGRLYEGVNAAETNQERGTIVLQHLLEPLDSGYEPDKIDPTVYEEEIAPKIAEEIALETPETELFRYDDGDQLMYDTVTGTLGNSPIAAALGDMINVPEDNGASWRSKLKTSGLQLEAMATRSIMEQLGSRIAGVADPYGDHMVEEPPEQETLAYSVPGIERLAARTGKSPEEVRDYVVTHEGIHTVQQAHYPDLLEERRTFVADVAKQMQKDEAGAGTVRMDKDTAPTMTLIEGHAEFYTDKIFNEPIRSNVDKSILDRIVGAILLPHKQAQYEDGKAFFEFLHERGGNDYVDHTMAHPPETTDELDDPHKWADQIEAELAA